MFFETKKTDLAGRIGRLLTPHGVVETPYLFPVIDPARQVPDLDKIREVGFSGIITNAYLFYKRNQGKATSIHEYLKWNSVIMTDSGGYQILVYGDVEVDNRTIIEYEKRIGSDIAVILDIPTGSKMSLEEAEKAVHETYRRGLEALPLIEESNQLWVYPIQGAPYKDLVVRSAILARKLPYDIYAVGSPTVILEKYNYPKLVELVATVRMHIPPSKPLHVFGVGHPMIVPFLVAVGADLFDSASYILYARDGRYMTEAGTKNIRELSYFPCTCPVCSRYTPQEVLALPNSKKVELIALHNLYMLMKEIKTTKQYIKEGRLWELLEQRSRSHPALAAAFNIVKNYFKLLAKHAPLASPSGRAVFIISADSFFNPRIAINVKRGMEITLKDVEGKTIILIPAYKKPYDTQNEYLAIVPWIEKRDDVKIAFIHPVLGVFAPGLSVTYPYYQHICKLTKSSIAYEKLVKYIRELVRKKPREVIIVNTSWMNSIADKLRDELAKLDSKSVKVTICKLSDIFSRLPR